MLPNKKKETYVRMLREIGDAAGAHSYQFQPKVFFTDFEASVFAAIDEVFPLAEKKGCLFHYSQCIWRKVTKIQVRKKKRCMIL
jgi:hypothetical protein